MTAFQSEVRSFAAAAGKTPQNILRLSVGANWDTWDAWCRGAVSPRVETLERVLAYMRANPASDLSQPQRKDVA
ncbi:hypothetical protein [Thioclava sp. GXIMD2076]|uniref:hypothetical protein n=1 Tax=Thioclava sp. GXIMD2076 TaxID=3131931 RepID=UPI0030D052F5